MIRSSSFLSFPPWPWTSPSVPSQPPCRFNLLLPLICACYTCKPSPGGMFSLPKLQKLHLLPWVIPAFPGHPAFPPGLWRLLELCSPGDWMFIFHALSLSALLNVPSLAYVGCYAIILGLSLWRGPASLGGHRSDRNYQVGCQAWCHQVPEAYSSSTVVIFGREGQLDLKKYC